jgi:hypothetical protein
MVSEIGISSSSVLSPRKLVMMDDEHALRPS